MNSAQQPPGVHTLSWRVTRHQRSARPGTHHASPYARSGQAGKRGRVWPWPCWTGRRPRGVGSGLVRALAYYMPKVEGACWRSATDLSRANGQRCMLARQHTWHAVVSYCLNTASGMAQQHGYKTHAPFRKPSHVVSTGCRMSKWGLPLNPLR